MEEVTDRIIIDEKTIHELVHDMAKSAEAADLIYSPDSELGFSRKNRGKVFSYFDGTKKIKDHVTIERINKLRIPPAWENVWICKKLVGIYKPLALMYYEENNIDTTVYGIK